MVFNKINDELSTSPYFYNLVPENLTDVWIHLKVRYYQNFGIQILYAVLMP